MGFKKKSFPIDETDIPSVGRVGVGKSLKHPLFGVGRVVEIAQWESGDFTICLEFAKYGKKWLSLEHTNLSETDPKPKVSGYFSRWFGR